jgi:hypothetical protein
MGSPRFPGLAFGLALAVRPAGSAETSGVSGGRLRRSPRRRDRRERPNGGADLLLNTVERYDRASEPQRLQLPQSCSGWQAAASSRSSNRWPLRASGRVSKSRIALGLLVVCFGIRLIFFTNLARNTCPPGMRGLEDFNG